MGLIEMKVNDFLDHAAVGFAASTLLHHARRSVRRLRDMSRVRGMYPLVVQIENSVRASIPLAAFATADSDFSGKIWFIAG